MCACVSEWGRLVQVIAHQHANLNAGLARPRSTQPARIAWYTENGHSWGWSGAREMYVSMLVLYSMVLHKAIHIEALLQGIPQQYVRRNIW